MTFFSRVALRGDAAGQQAVMRLLLADGRRDGDHRLIWTLFSEDPAAPRDFLYRETEAGHYLIVSQRPPRAASEIWRVETKPYAPVLAAGTRAGFQLRANPIASLRGEPGQRGRRRDVMALAPPGQARDAAALAWLAARAERIGVRLDASDCAIEGARTLEIGHGGGRLRAVDFRGVLTVDDPARLQTAAIAGVGRGKAYGCGLLLLRPLAEAAPPGAR